MASTIARAWLSTGWAGANSAKRRMASVITARAEANSPINASILARLLMVTVASIGEPLASALA